ncbi:MGMT family protein [Spiroplasma endosymbiont of Polydrusus formosus]|uniref:MGMT family protein n=1 Tax=Spiroplasma endosymbiont of Polydrusus formosus TaxID=3139326 RepID=UPI0035B4FAC9
MLTKKLYFIVWFYRDFFKKVWAEVAKIPYGTTTCYVDIAQKIGHPQTMQASEGSTCNNNMTKLLSHIIVF